MEQCIISLLFLNLSSHISWMRPFFKTLWFLLMLLVMQNYLFEIMCPKILKQCKWYTFFILSFKYSVKSYFIEYFTALFCSSEVSEIGNLKLFLFSVLPSARFWTLVWIPQQRPGIECNSSHAFLMHNQIVWKWLLALSPSLADSDNLCHTNSP